MGTDFIERYTMGYIFMKTLLIQWIFKNLCVKEHVQCMMDIISSFSSENLDLPKIMSWKFMPESKVSISRTNKKVLI